MLWSNFWKWFHPSTRKASPKVGYNNTEESSVPTLYFCSPHKLRRSWNDLHWWLSKECPIDNRVREEDRIPFLHFALEAIKEDLQGYLLSKIVYTNKSLAKMNAEKYYWFPVKCDMTIKEMLVPLSGNTIFVMPYKGGSIAHAMADVKKEGIRCEDNSFDGSYFPDLQLIILRNGVHHTSAAKLLKDPGLKIKCEVFKLASSYPRVKIVDMRYWKLPDGRKILIYDPRFAMLYLLCKELYIGVTNGDQLALKNQRGMLSEEELPDIYKHLSEKSADICQKQLICEDDITASVIDVAQYILNNAGCMPTIKLQKLVYYCQVWSLVWNGVPLFREDFQAWANGPICPELFTACKGHFRLNPHFYKDHEPYDFIQPQIDIMDTVLDGYADRSLKWLTKQVQKDRLWLEIRRGVKPGEPCNFIIPKELMLKYYSKLETIAQTAEQANLLWTQEELS